MKKVNQIRFAHVELFRNAIKLRYLKICTRLCKNLDQCLNVTKRLDALERVETVLTAGFFGFEEKVWYLNKKTAQLSEVFEALGQLKNFKKIKSCALL